MVRFYETCCSWAADEAGRAGLKVQWKRRPWWFFLICWIWSQGGQTKIFISSLLIFVYFSQNKYYDWNSKTQTEYRMFWNVKICIWKDFKLFWTFSHKIIYFRSFWTIDKHIKIWFKKTSIFLSVSAKKTSFCPKGGGSESYGHVGN